MMSNCVIKNSCQNDFIETKLLKKLLANYDKQALPIENGKPGE